MALSPRMYSGWIPSGLIISSLSCFRQLRTLRVSSLFNTWIVEQGTRNNCTSIGTFFDSNIIFCLAFTKLPNQLLRWTSLFKPLVFTLGSWHRNIDIIKLYYYKLFKLSRITFNWQDKFRLFDNQLISYIF